MTLYLLRHADAVMQAPSDALRPLSPKGEAQAATVARAMRRLNIVPAVVLMSPLLRARQTAQTVIDELSITNSLVSEHLTPSSDHRQIIAQMQERTEPEALLVGHEPHLSTFISLLIGDTRTAQVEMRKASLARVDFSSSIQKGAGVLRWLMTVEQMGAGV